MRQGSAAVLVGFMSLLHKARITRARRASDPHKARVGLY